MSGEVQHRKRKDKRKKKIDEGTSRQEDILLDQTEINGKNEEEHLLREDSEEKSQDSHDHHHGPTAGVGAKIIFFILFAGLLVAMGTIFFQIRGTEIRDTPIKESRYASILENFIEEYSGDEHDEHEEHDLPHADEHGDTDEHEADQEEGETHEPPLEPDTKPVPDVVLEPSMPETIEIPEPSTEDEIDEEKEGDEEVVEENEIIEETNEDETEQLPRKSEENVQEEDLLRSDEIEQDASLEAENIEKLEEYPTEEIPQLADQETRKEYIKIIDDVLREQQHLQQQHQNQQKIDDRSSYPQSAITNDYDFEIRKEIDEADELIDKAPDRAVTQFQSILELHPKSPRAVFGKALAMSRLSDVHKSNQILEQSIYTYKDVLDLPDVPDELFRLAGLKCVDRMRFRGFHIKSLKVLDRLIHRFPTDYSFSNQKAVTYLLMGRNKDAKESLEEALKLNPADGFAKCHYGFILKIEENNNKLAIKYLREGIATQEPGTIDGRFYFHLGDALMRENQSTEAYKVYQQGTQKGLFLSVYQRSLYNVRNLKAIPWWTHEQSTYQPYIKMLEKNWKKIRAEAVPLLNDENQGFFPENEGLRNKGIWKQFEMFARGRKITQNCERTPFTCQLIENIPEAKDCKRGQVKFSLLMPGTKVWPHTGPTNCRLRSHLGLVVPEGTAIRVANETRKWKEGKVMIFDDSFEHEVWHEGTSYRLILIVDFWHPDLTEAQKQTLTPI